MITLRATGQTDGVVHCRENDWVTIVVDDPHGPLLGILGTVTGYDEVRESVAVQVDDSGAAYWIPTSTIRFVHAIDGPVMESIEPTN